MLFWSCLLFIFTLHFPYFEALSLILWLLNIIKVSKTILKLAVRRYQSLVLPSKIKTFSELCPHCKNVHFLWENILQICSNILAHKNKIVLFCLFVFYFLYKNNFETCFWNFIFDTVWMSYQTPFYFLLCVLLFLRFGFVFCVTFS